MKSQILDLALCSMEELQVDDRQRVCETGHDSLFAADPPTPRGQIRQELITQVRARLKKGYYSSGEVIDDLSESFARAFNQIS